MGEEMVGQKAAIRDYIETDARAVGILIADTYGEFNLSFVPSAERGAFLGPFQHARSARREHREAIARAIASETVLVAEADGEIVGVLRGRASRIASLFVRGDRHRQGTGRRLVERFERQSVAAGIRVIRVAATLHAIPFYSKLGYRRSTGVRPGWSFEGVGLTYQPMRKVLADSDG